MSENIGLVYSLAVTVGVSSALNVLLAVCRIVHQSKSITTALTISIICSVSFDISYIFTGVAILLLVINSDVSSDVTNESTVLCNVGGVFTLIGVTQSLFILAVKSVLAAVSTGAKVQRTSPRRHFCYFGIFQLLQLALWIVLCSIPLSHTSIHVHALNSTTQYMTCIPVSTELNSSSSWKYSCFILVCLCWCPMFVAACALLLCLHRTFTKSKQSSCLTPLHLTVQIILWLSLVILASVAFFRATRTGPIRWIMAFIVAGAMLVHFILEIVTVTSCSVKDVTATKQTNNNNNNNNTVQQQQQQRKLNVGAFQQTVPQQLTAVTHCHRHHAVIIIPFVIFPLLTP